MSQSPAGRPAPITAEDRAAIAGVAKWWWVLLLTAAAWLVIGIIVLQYDTRSLRTVGFFVGGMLIATGIEQFLVAGAVDRMKWVFWIFGGLFIAAGVVSLFNPLSTAASLAASIGFIFILIAVFWGLEAFLSRSVNPMWWVGLIAAAVMIGMGIWLGNQGLAEKVVSTLAFVGTWALIHAFTDVLRAFQLRKVGKLVSAVPA